MTVDRAPAHDPMLLTARQRWTLLVVLGAGLVLIALDNSILYTALPTLTRELGASSTEGLWIINAYPVVMAGLLLGAGTLGDRVGHRRMFLIGLVVFAGASLVAAFAPNPGVLIAGRAALAVGAAAMMPSTLALIRVTFRDDRERNIAIAIWGSLAIVGGAAGPLLGGLLLERLWWGSVFLINVPIAVLAFAVAARIAPPNDADPSKRWDLVSSLQIMVTLVGLVVAIKELATSDPSWPVAVIALIATVGGALVFTRRQRRLPYPLLDLTIFRNPAFLSGVLAAGFAMFATGGVQLVTTQRFQLVSDFSPLQAGLLVSALVLGSLPTALLGGAFLHVIGMRYLISGGLFVAAAGVLTTLYGISAGFGWVIGGLALAGMGLGAVMAVASTAIIGNVPARRAGMASSVEEVSYEFGNLTAVALLGALLGAVYTGTVELPAGAPAAAHDSLIGAITTAGSDRGILDAAFSAFDHGYAVVMVIAAAVLALAAAITAVLLRRYGPGSASSAYDSSH
ncbi:MFS transporter [Saccharomonospora sp. NPDC046836]|uniref:MFS transporter n=1 Tax=Saccharomonospora sp. NPDC046836 TaxID=3156921 RepID=UPI00340C9F09